MEIRIPKELLEYLDAVRGEKSRQAYLVNLLAEDKESSGDDKVLKTILKKDFKGASK